MQKVFSISELNHTLQGLISSQLGVIKVDGEISNFVKPASGHYYFTLKDNKAQIRCVMFKSTNRYLDSIPKNGDKIIARAMPSLYEPRGELQLVVEHIEPAGLGNLLLKLEKLKQKIRLKGWCDLDKKRPLPRYPKSIALVTSATGAVLFDVLNVLKRRAPSVSVVIYPAIVQGHEAVNSLCNALKLANKRQQEDVIILARGGGSIEDLWSFNDETVLATVYQSTIPIICGVGHETDNTLAELVADAFAPTPSAAAEITSEQFPLLSNKINQLAKQLQKNIHLQLDSKANQYQHVLVRLNAQYPQKSIQNYQQQCDYLTLKLNNAISIFLQTKKDKIKNIKRLLKHFSPIDKLQKSKKTVSTSLSFSAGYLNQLLNKNKQKHAFLTAKLKTLDPKATLKRGYSITQNSKGEVLTSSLQVTGKDTLKTTLYDGILMSNINNNK